MSECKPCQLIQCQVPNEFSYSITVPLATPPNPALPFGNDQLMYCCPGGETITVTGTLPGWAFISGNCIIVAANSFRDISKINADAQAQSALNLLVDNQVTCHPSVFANSAATFNKTCTGQATGIYNGPWVCETVNAGIFTSTVSQLDADTQARYAAYIAMVGSSPFPCCTSPAVLSQGGWSNSSIPTQNTTDTEGRTANWTWNDTGAVLVFDLEMVSNITRPDTNAAILITMMWAYCNPWPEYNFHIHVDFSWDALNINGVGSGVGLTAIYANGSLTATPILSEPTGTAGHTTYDVFFPAGIGGDSIQILITLGNANTTHVASGSFSGTMTITPLVPPTFSFPTCGVISVKPSPFNYSLRPANDDFANATVVTGTSGNITFDDTYASLEPDEPVGIADRTGWYKWTAPHNGTVTFDPSLSTMPGDPVIDVYTGTALTNLVLVIEKNQTTPSFTWAAIGGTTYYWRIGGFFGNVGITRLAWSLV